MVVLTVSAFAVLGAAVPASAAPGAVPAAPSAGEPVAKRASLPAPSATKPGTTTTVTAASGATANTQAACPAPANKDEFTCFAQRRTDVPSAKGLLRNLNATAAPAGYGAADLQSAYDLPANGGAGATIAIVDAYDDPNAEGDLALYRQQYNLSPCTTANGCFRKVDETGGTAYPVPDPHWSEEISLDLDMVSAAAPDAHILLVEAGSAMQTDLGAAVDEAVALGAKYVSNSYGSNYYSTPGSGEDPAEHTELDGYYNHPGVVITASSGDLTYGVAYPASSPYVTAVGGTTLTKDSSARGWSESVWIGSGSGCSVYEPKPAFQTNAGCADRTVADVSAVADPNTGVAVYDSYQSGGGWWVYGGTSASAPIIASVYADAGTPKAGTYPNSYPYYADPADFNDVTTGTNTDSVNPCDPAYLCNGEPGYDGPTGVGTPNGVNGFAAAPQGAVKGTVTSGRQAVAGVKVSVGKYSTTTAADGSYEMMIPPGTYAATADAFGYQEQTASVVVTDGGTTTKNISLTAIPTVTVSGIVTAATPGWPLSASISVEGVPMGPVYTDPKTGAYSLKLPANASYTLDTSAAYPGYVPAKTTVAIGSADVTQNISVGADLGACIAPGYQDNLHGMYQTFDATSAPAGWTTTNNTTNRGWVFNDPAGRGNQTGGTGGFAIVDSAFLPPHSTVDSTLTSPVIDLSSAAAPVISFNTYYNDGGSSTLDPPTVSSVDASLDGGATWTTVWQPPSKHINGSLVSIPFTSAAGDKTVQVRFHYNGTWAGWWELDNLLVGDTTCDPTPGGLVIGQVTDANTGAALPGAAVSENGTASGTSVTTANPALKGAFYWFFSPTTGQVPVTAVKSPYATATNTVTVPQGGVVEADVAMDAGRLAVTPGSVTTTTAWGGTATKQVTVKNTGTAPATLKISESPQSGTQQGAAAGAPPQQVKTTLITGDLALAAKANPNTASATPTAPASTATAGTAWQPTADLPGALADDIADTDNGTLYAGFGFTGDTSVGYGDSNALYKYNPTLQSWTQLASASESREGAAHGFIGGKLYVTGGWGGAGLAIARTEVYDPSTNTWSTTTDSPAPYAGSASAVIGSSLYVVGGCVTNTCATLTDDVYSFNATTGTWTKLAPYPESIGWASCGNIEGQLYCAGGTPNGNNGVADTFTYDPQTNTWSRLASLPATVFGAASASANGELLLQNGGVNGYVSNQGFAYDPETDSWSALPNSTVATYLGAGAPGFSLVGGLVSYGIPTASTEILPGYDVSSSGGVPWMSENAGDASNTQPATYTGSLFLQSDTPYRLAPVPVSMTVNPPKGWGQVAGVVQYTDASGATVP
ncbi:MAG TPA: kelch repeat-containing protein, partial [Amycolatopsis sp.]|nr:kelch repeat-containing protein [Amycolatopsis sp.]